MAVSSWRGVSLAALLKEAGAPATYTSLSVEAAQRVPEALEAQVRQVIEQVVAQIDNLDYAHNIIVRRSPADPARYHVALEAHVAADTPVAEAHHLSSLLEHELGLRLPGVVDVFVHLEPPESEPRQT
mgnify:CR=1 FL=1